MRVRTGERTGCCTDRVSVEGLSNEAAFELRPGRSKGLNPVKIQKSTPVGRIASAKALRLEGSCMFKAPEEGWGGARWAGW